MSVEKRCLLTYGKDIWYGMPPRDLPQSEEVASITIEVINLPLMECLPIMKEIADRIGQPLRPVYTTDVSTWAAASWQGVEMSLEAFAELEQWMALNGWVRPLRSQMKARGE